VAKGTGTVAESSLSDLSQSSPKQTSPHFPKTQVYGSLEAGTEDGDEMMFPEESKSAGTALKLEGVRYLRPARIGQSFATTDQNDPADQYEFFVSRDQNMFTIDAQDESQIQQLTGQQTEKT